MTNLQNEGLNGLFTAIQAWVLPETKSGFFCLLYQPLLLLVQGEERSKKEQHPTHQILKDRQDEDLLSHTQLDQLL